MLLTFVLAVFHWLACGWVMVGTSWCTYDVTRRACFDENLKRSEIRKEWRRIYALNLCVRAT